MVDTMRKREWETETYSSNYHVGYNPYDFGHDSDEQLSFKCSECEHEFKLYKGNLKLCSNRVIGPVEKLLFVYECPECGQHHVIPYSDIRLFE